MQAPVLAGVSGRACEEFVFDNTTSPMTVTPDLAALVRPEWPDPRQTPAGLSVRAVDDQHVEITRPDTGLDAGALYELTYTGRDPTVLCTGYAMTRDVATFLRRETGTANPLAAHGKSLVGRAILFGISQSGRFVRDYLYLGFNQDTAGQIVFEGMMPHVGGARRMATNVRFGQPAETPAVRRTRPGRRTSSLSPTACWMINSPTAATGCCYAASLPIAARW